MIKDFKNSLREIWEYRELFVFLSLRDFLVKYKQTVLGIFWAILQPTLTMIIFAFVFGKVAKLSTSNIPYSIMVFSALLPWQLFSSSLLEISNSLINNRNMITKIYFPRIILPISSLFVNFVDFLVSFIILLILFIIYKFRPSFNLLLVIPLIFLTIITALGIGLVISSLNVKYRDFRYVVPFSIQVGLYISPIGYSSDLIPGIFKNLYSLNPMVGIIEGFRYSILGEYSSNLITSVYISIVISLLLLVVGIHYFNKTEKDFSDII